MDLPAGHADALAQHEAIGIDHRLAAKLETRLTQRRTFKRQPMHPAGVYVGSSSRSRPSNSATRARTVLTLTIAPRPCGPADTTNLDLLHECLRVRWPLWTRAVAIAGQTRPSPTVRAWPRNGRRRQFPSLFPAVARRSTVPGGAWFPVRFHLYFPRMCAL